MSGVFSSESDFHRTIRNLATDGQDAKPRLSRRLLNRLNANARLITQAHRSLSHYLSEGESVPPEAEWLLDNYYVIDDVIRQIRDHLPRSYSRQLPTLDAGLHAGYPRIYPLAATIVGQGERPLTEEIIRTSVDSYQQTSALRIGELWAVPIMLRIAAIELLRTIVDRILTAITDRTQAMNDLSAIRRGESRRLPTAPSDSYRSAAWSLIREDGVVLDVIERWASQHLTDPHDISHREFGRQAANQVSIGNVVTTLRLLAVIDWKEFFEATSLIESMLRRDPGNVYLRQDFATRDRCRHAVETLARISRRPELDVAQAAIAAASRPQSHGNVSYYLIGDGQVRFRRELGDRRQWWQRLREWFRGRPGLLYFSPLVGFTLLILVMSGFALSSTSWFVFGVGLLAIGIVASEISVALTNALVRAFTNPYVLPKLDFREGIPVEWATIVVIPTLIGRPEQARDLSERLERHYLSNPDPALSFALLIDFTDAASETTSADDACIEALAKEIDTLNATYSGVGPTKFYVFHRKRMWNASEDRWMGWERKRGKLDEFNQLLRGSQKTSYVISPEAKAAIPTVRFVLTLDTDTVLPRDSAKQMIATLAHPLNRPRLTDDGRRVKSGFAILQPRVSFLYRAGFRSWFSRIFAGSSGIDPYSSATSDTYMDLFGRGSFTGKGLYDIDAFAATAGQAFPENAILSHDLIESNYGRCALATDIEVYDEFPSRTHVYARRDHRWIRGDWQLLPWLGFTVPTPQGERQQNVLPLVERWKVLDNLRRSLVMPASLGLLVLAWTVLPAPAWIWAILAIVPWLMPSLMLTLMTLFHFHSRAAIRAFPVKLRFEFANTYGQAFLHLVFLADWARLAIDAIARTLYRLIVSRRRMLEWETSATSETRLQEGLPQFFRSMWPASAMAIAIATLITILSPERLLLASPVLFAWFLSPVIGWIVSRSRVHVDKPLNAEEDAELRRIAKRTWSFFETYVGEPDNWLPPDNYQESPLGLVAHRTSPTNIGLYLLSVLAAHDFQYITTREMADRLHRAFDSIDRLERYRGHLYNWYETNTLATMSPPYVSTVDSGNLLACLIALKHGLLELSNQDSDLKAEITTIAGRADVLAAGMNFGFLYNTERELFSIGFNAATGRLDTNHYDLLASESCIASFLAVARGEVPRKHWFQLSRLVTRSAGRIGLVSWGGTMFEYLMPRLLLPTAPGVLLDQAQRTAVARQIEYGRETGRPWGISESGFALTDAAQVYQYQSFGAPGLGLKRGLAREHVVAPYATLLAVDIDAVAAIRNFAAIKRVGGEGLFGFYEALDYSPERLGSNGEPRVVRSYMAHHQGMGFVSIANRLHGGIMRQRFSREPAVKSAELLLDERVPYTAPVIDPDGPVSDVPREVDIPEYPMKRRITTPHTPIPRTHLLSNGRFTTMVTNAGGGYSRCGDLDLTRWQADPTIDGDGTFIYVRDRRNGTTWSAAYHPTHRKADEYEAIYSIDKAEFRRVDGDIETRMDICVVPDQDAEIRRITLTNHSTRPHMLDVTSYAEIVLAPHAADAAHPAFNKLFLETEWIDEKSAILCRRRPRSANQEPVFAVHLLTTDVPGSTSFETSRETFIGRRRNRSQPYALDRFVDTLQGTVGTVLDPIASIRRTVLIKPGERATLAFTSGMARTRDDAIAMANRLGNLAAIAHAFELSWAQAQIELQGSHWRAEDVHLFQRLAGLLHYSNGPLRSPSEILISNHQGQSGLWPFGISGDLPILLLRIHSRDGLTHLRLLLHARAYWQAKNFQHDFVVLLENAGGYHDDLHEEAINLVRHLGLGDRLNRADGIFVRKGFQMTETDRTVLLAAARVVLDDRQGSVGTQSDTLPAPTSRPARRVRPTPATQFKKHIPNPDLQFANAFGGFSSDGRVYFIHADRVPPAPWSNVIANERSGFLVTESGSGFVWAGNSQSNRLTPWSNDPVIDASGEAIYLHDESTATLWSPTPQPVSIGAPTRVQHGQGWTSFERDVENVQSELTVFVPLADPVKISLLTLRNTGTKIKRLEVVYYLEWVLGSTREATSSSLLTLVDTETGAVFCGNRSHPDFPHHLAFADLDLRPRTVTGDRKEFLGRNGTMALPLSFGRTALSGTMGPGLDPCTAIRGNLTLSPGETRTVVLVVGQADSSPEARRIIRDYRNPVSARLALKQVKEQWTRIGSAVQVETPDSSFNFLMNHWLIYQTLSCRLWGRSAFYQSGGAFGFRDQLQDVCALVHTTPDIARSHILRAARRQFVEGDVQHWWHEPAGNGVRTRISDDFLWLPYVVAHYVKVTGDRGILDETLPYLDAPILTPEQHEVYGVPGISDQSETVFQHCERAIANGWKLGVHGLPLIGTGDWNDGMNTVGSEGRGESVWMAWFLTVVLEHFADLAEHQGESTLVQTCRMNAAQLRDAVETHAWDGEWYRRAYFDDGTPLGSASNEECQIDSIAQSWAVIAGGQRERAAIAMQSVLDRLVRADDRIIRLFDPPFDRGALRPGYIRGYVPGVRENGGQYTHAAVWMVIALAKSGRGDEAYEAFSRINPINMPTDSYRGEPYVIAADVYSNPQHLGRAGWTWYTGSSSWLYRVGLEEILGLKREGNRLRIQPCIPSTWPSYHLRYRFGSSEYEIEVVNSPRASAKCVSIQIDGKKIADDFIPLIDNGARYTVRVIYGHGIAHD
jgi:cyclic beta-1,2-glucan synthetase